MKVRALLVTVVTTLASLLAAPAQAGEQPHGRWAEPVVRVYAPELPNGWKLGRAIRDWNRAGVVDIKRVGGPCGICVTVAEVAPYLVEGVDVRWHGLAYVNAPEGVILDCRIDLASDVHPNVRPRITAHELGHCLGLAHRESATSAMGGGLRRPGWSDWRNLAHLYDTEPPERPTRKR